MLRDPLVCPSLEEIERKGSAVEHLIVKGADVELRAELFLCSFTQFAELELAKFVTEGLRGPGDVTVGFRLDAGLVDGAGLSEEIYNLLSCPSLRVNSGIDN